jgi:hypothetical protein
MPLRRIKLALDIAKIDLIFDAWSWQQLCYGKRIMIASKSELWQDGPDDFF